MTKDDLFNMRRNLIGALKLVEKHITEVNVELNKGKKITEKGRQTETDLMKRKNMAVI